MLLPERLWYHQLSFLQSRRNSSFMLSMSVQSSVSWLFIRLIKMWMYLLWFFSFSRLSITQQDWKTRTNNLNIQTVNKFKASFNFPEKGFPAYSGCETSYQCFLEERKFVHYILYWEIVISLRYFKTLAPNRRLMAIHWQRLNNLLVLCMDVSREIVLILSVVNTIPMYYGMLHSVPFIWSTYEKHIGKFMSLFL